MKLYLAFLVIFLSAFTFGESGNDFTDLEMHKGRLLDGGCTSLYSACTRRQDCCTSFCDVKEGYNGTVCVCSEVDTPCFHAQECCSNHCGVKQGVDGYVCLCTGQYHACETAKDCCEWGDKCEYFSNFGTKGWWCF